MMILPAMVVEILPAMVILNRTNASWVCQAWKNVIDTIKPDF